MNVGRKLTVIGGGSVRFNAGVPEFVVQSGDFANAIVDTGVGNITINTLSDNGIAANQCFVTTIVRGVLAASQLTTVACNHTSNTAKQFTILREGAAGAVSALADVDFDFTFFAVE